MTAQHRKENSEKVLSSYGIILIDELPPIEEESIVQLRSAQDVAKRILILTYLNCVATDPSLRQEVMMFLIREKLWDHASPIEKSYFHKSPLSEQEMTIILWRAESIWMLLWAIEKVEKIDLPETEVNLHDIFPLLPGFFESTTDFVVSAELRSVDQILDQADLMFRMSWALRQPLDENSSTKKFNPGIAYERFFAINWVMSEGSWDN